MRTKWNVRVQRSTGPSTFRDYTVWAADAVIDQGWIIFSDEHGRTKAMFPQINIELVEALEYENTLNEDLPD